jgi:predicted nucleotidyltransferase
VVEERGQRGVEKFGLGADALKLIRSVFHRHPQVQKVEVFGSRAMGHFESNSDVDLVIWGDIDMILMGRIVGELDELPLPYTFDVKAYDSIRHDPLKRHIDEFGKTLYIREPSSASH